MAGPYSVYKRPYLDEFLSTVFSMFEVGIWTSSTEVYAESVISALKLPNSTVFLWSRDRCARVFDPEMQTHYFLKDLKKVRRRGYDLDRVIMVDDTPEKLSRHYGNYLKVTPFLGDPGDEELMLLSKYLPCLASCDSIRSVEKRGWRSSVNGEL